MAQRGEDDEDGDAGIADQFLAAGDLEQHRGGGEGRKTLQDRGEDKTTSSAFCERDFLEPAMAAIGAPPDDPGMTPEPTRAGSM